MRLDTVERLVRLAGGLGAAVFVVGTFQRLARGWRRPMGRVSGPVPGFVRGYARGAWWFYVPGTILGLGLLRLLWRPIRRPLSSPLRALALVVGALLYFPGLAIMFWGRSALGEMYNVSSAFGAQLYAEHRLVTSGPFALVRHPMYLGGALAELGALLIYRTWATALVALQIPDLVLRSRREEEVLAAQFGQQWEEYRGRVPGWIPRIRR
ncbi:MAG: isoprenylcysteine carboxylmethyltransferase family protein [Chloroflexi bacterium]|nr:isoprenylcysteine carboxylmethyltransferase family protein [Chloroflexota bacterium]